MRFTKITDIEELKTLFLEILLSKTDKVTKVSDNSVLSGIGFGVAKVGQKALVEVARVESLLFPDAANGSQLDQIANNFGISPRFGASSSSTYVKIFAEEGTTYLASNTVISGTQGVNFKLEKDLTIGSQGFEYAKISTDTVGEFSNVPALSLVNINPTPAGHQLVINEYSATGGRDLESDESFRRRIKGGVNLLAKPTLDSLEQVFININDKVLKIFFQGRGKDGYLRLAVASVDGSDFTEQELNSLLQQGGKWLSLADQRPNGFGRFGIKLINVEYQPLDVNFRVELDGTVETDVYRKQVQTRFSKYIDTRKFDPTKEKVEWDDLLQIAKSTRGARYVPDRFFFLNGGRVDVKIQRNKMPRFRSFLLFDSLGVVIEDDKGNLDPVFFPNQIDYNYQMSVLNV